ncbi:hypothetical protein DVH24_029072 [Malus domestica]|uniref:Uncharacterized protein n=1 Tax=Malus domestica TaxID=3750 RepID=A0A498HYW6_MALDO|nr:hypothetical protein DVH24_029072 [Malus domestica]
MNYLSEGVCPQSGNFHAHWFENDLVHETFWELTGFGFYRNFEVKRDRSESNPKMGGPFGSSLVSSQKQNREGVVGAQSGQYRATAESSPGCGRCPGRDIEACYPKFVEVQIE